MRKPISPKLEKAVLLCKKGRFDIFLYRFLSRLGLRNNFLPLPYSLMIEPTNACNLHCPTCPTGSGKMNRPARMMSLAEFKSIVDQVKKYIVEIFLWNYGEPFLNNELLKMIKYADSAGIYTVTSTNSQFFKSKEFGLEVIRSGLRHLIICLDGMDQEILAKFRGENVDFESILKGFEFIRDAKDEQCSRTPIIELQFIVMKHNEHQRKDAAELAKKMKADIYCEKTAAIDSNDPDFQRLAEDFLPRDLSQSRFYLRNDGRFAPRGEAADRCSIIYQSSVINSDGNVIPCCYDLYSDFVMGNVFKEDFRSIWNNAKYAAFRQRIAAGRESINICNACSESRYAISRRRQIK